MKIYFDMDGTLANLYGVENWLEKLRAEDSSPYEEAEPMCDLRLLARLLNKAQKNGNEIGIISWLSKEATAEYDEAVRISKKNGLLIICRQLYGMKFILLSMARRSILIVKIILEFYLMIMKM